MINSIYLNISSNNVGVDDSVHPNANTDINTVTISQVETVNINNETEVRGQMSEDRCEEEIEEIKTYLVRTYGVRRENITINM